MSAIGIFLNTLRLLYNYKITKRGKKLSRNRSFQLLILKKNILFFVKNLFWPAF